MDWLLATPQIQSTFSSLGYLEGGTYVVNPNALAILEEIIYKLTYEDQTLRTFRRAIGFGQNVRSDLILLLENANDNAILDAVIRILVNLTVPVECLFSVDVMYRTEVGRHTVFELNKLLYTSKEAFTDPKSTKSVIEYMKHLLESDHKLSPHNCDQINNCLLLLRNILHIPENNANFIMPTTLSPGSRSVPMQNTILWNLFIQSIDKLLLYLMSCPQRAFWGVTMVQLIALIYKDQHVSTLQKLLNVWFEASLSESSEDNESNTSPPKECSGDSSPMLTSDPTSDSSDNGSGMCKIECTSEERNQVLREETDATLQEVSRKSQEYHDAILRAEGSGENKEMCISQRDGISLYADFKLNKNVNNIDVEAMEEIEAAEYEEDLVLSNNNQNSNENQVEQHKQELSQPAKHLISTTNTLMQTEVQFKPPVAMPIKIRKISAQSGQSAFKYTNELADNSSQTSSQKSPHCGQLNLTKGKSLPQKRECPSSQSELSDCGYGTQVENQESISTSSNDDDGPQIKPLHQKPPCNTKPRTKQRAVLTVFDNKELRRKKLVKRSKSNLINMKGLVQHMPLDEDISNLLKEFTVDFLLKGFGSLVEELHSQLLTHMKVPIDTSHFFWLLTYFLKFAVQLELDMEHIYSILNFDVLSYLTYEGVAMSEQLELSVRQEGSDMKPYLRRIHLIVTAIREFLQAIQTYKNVTHLTDDDHNRLRSLQIQISGTEDLRSLFVLLIRRFNPNLHTKQYLQDLVVTNHILLTILDSVNNSQENCHFNMIEHISQFATLEIMHYYGMLLEDFKSNDEFVNDCIFTMMHHIGGDLGQIGTLFQPQILKTYSRIWETEYGLCDDWSDLMEYVIHTFMKTPQKSKLALPNSSLTELTKEYNSENTVCAWTQEEMDTLYWYYVQSKNNSDIAGKIANLFKNNGNKHKSRISIIQQLLQQDIITLVEYDDMMKFEDSEYHRSLLTTSTLEAGIGSKGSASSCDKPGKDIQILRELIQRDNKQKNIVWLQKLLLECCYIKIVLKSTNCGERQNLKYIMEPVAYHNILKNQPVPLVQWNTDLASIMMYEPFVLLIHKLGLQLPVDTGSLFIRIPDNWTAETLYNLASKLGPLDNLLIKFDLRQLEEASTFSNHGIPQTQTSIPASSGLKTDSIKTDMEIPLLQEVVEPVPESNLFAVPKPIDHTSAVRHAPESFSPSAMPNWLQLVMRSKCNTAAVTPAAAENPEKPDAHVRMSSINSNVFTTSIDTMPTSSFKSFVTSKSTSISTSTLTSISSSTSTSTSTSISTSTSTLPLHNFLTTPSLPIAVTLQAPTQLPYPSISNIIGSQLRKQYDDTNQNGQQSTYTTTDKAATILNNYVARSAATDTFVSTPSTNIYQTPETPRYVVNTTDSSVKINTFQRNLEQEYSAMVASVYENEMAISDCASVASDLTHMYVSDEEEKDEYHEALDNKYL